LESSLSLSLSLSLQTSAINPESLGALLSHQTSASDPQCLGALSHSHHKQIQNLLESSLSLTHTHTLTTSFCNKLLAHKISRPLKSKHKRNPILIEMIPHNRGKRKKNKLEKD
jgi:hypothetical protein